MSAAMCSVCCNLGTGRQPRPLKSHSRGLTSSRVRGAGGAKPLARLLGGTKALPADGLAGASSLSFFCRDQGQVKASRDDWESLNQHSCSPCLTCIRWSCYKQQVLTGDSSITTMLQATNITASSLVSLDSSCSMK